jgi:hypothetical protein
LNSTSQTAKYGIVLSAYVSFGIAAIDAVVVNGVGIFS